MPGLARIWTILSFTIQSYRHWCLLDAVFSSIAKYSVTFSWRLMMFWVWAGFYRSQYTTVMNAGPQKGIRSFNRSKITPAKMMSGWSYTSVSLFILVCLWQRKWIWPYPSLRVGFTFQWSFLIHKIFPFSPCLIVFTFSSSFQLA